MGVCLYRLTLSLEGSLRVEFELLKTGLCLLWSGSLYCPFKISPLLLRLLGSPWGTGLPSFPVPPPSAFPWHLHWEHAEQRLPTSQSIQQAPRPSMPWPYASLPINPESLLELRALEGLGGPCIHPGMYSCIHAFLLLSSPTLILLHGRHLLGSRNEALNTAGMVLPWRSSQSSGKERF